jgi:type II secretory pathway pseudopilin PulG
MMKSMKKMLGVTLLEIMLVLAIAAMVIVMSIRYYQSANTAQQTNSILSQIQAIGAAADSLAQGAGTYTAATQANVTSLMPAGGMTTPWGTAVTIVPAATTYTVTIAGMPPGVCAGLVTRLAANGHFGTLSACGAAAANFSYTYTANI